MPDAHSTPHAGSSKAAKPARPYPAFPLYPHGSGHWAKKIRDKTHYFGPWFDPDAALTKCLEQKEALHGGRKPRPDAEALTIKNAVNPFLNHKQALVKAGELSPKTWGEYKATTDVMVAHFGKQRRVDDLGPDAFAELRDKITRK